SALADWAAIACGSAAGVTCAPAAADQVAAASPKPITLLDFVIVTSSPGLFYVLFYYQAFGGLLLCGKRNAKTSDIRRLRPCRRYSLWLVGAAAANEAPLRLLSFNDRFQVKMYTGAWICMHHCCLV